MRKRRNVIAVASALFLACVQARVCAGAGELLPRHLTPKIQIAVREGLDYLAKTQAPDGSWSNSKDGASYPISMTALAGMAFLANGNTQTRGPYADQVRAAQSFLMRFSLPNGLITGPSQEHGRPMYGHGFSLMFLSCCYGSEIDSRMRRQLKQIIEAALKLTATAQSPEGGWTYIPGGGDEGSVTITQIQALRAAHLVGFTVPEGTIKAAIWAASGNPSVPKWASSSRRAGGVAAPSASSGTARCFSMSRTPVGIRTRFRSI